MLLSPTASALAQDVAVGSIAPSFDPSQLAPAQPLPGGQTMPGFSKLFDDTARNFSRLPRKQTLTWLSIGAAAAMLAHTQDVRVSNWVQGRLTGASKAGTALGSFPLELGGSLATYAVARMTNSPKAASLAVDLAQAQILAQSTTYAIKFAVNRTRPDGSARSFPSGHTSVAFASATVMQRHFGWKVGIPAYAVASYVAASRLETNRHYLSDVAFGAVLGIVAGRTVTVGKGDARFALAPAAGPHSASVSFTWVGKK